MNTGTNDPAASKQGIRQELSFKSRGKLRGIKPTGSYGVMRFKRSERIQELLLEEISKLIQRGLKDPRIGFATIIQVNVSDNLKHANVYVSVMGTDEEKENTITGLESAKGFIRKTLGKNLYLRYIPELHFKNDDTQTRVDKISKILKDLHLE